MSERQIMFTYTFKNKKDESLYIQLYSFIKEDIISGRLSQGEKLPSKRAAAKNLGISIITVENAYYQLQSEGYIFSLPKKGFFVSEISELFTSEKEEKKEYKFTSTEQIEYKYDFTSNGIIADNFPFSIWSRLMRQTFTFSQNSLMTPSPSAGIKELKSAICRHLKQFRNMDVSPEQVVIGAGTEYLYSLIIQLLGRDKIYAAQNPGYSKITKIYIKNAVKCALIDETSSGIDTDMLEKSGADIAHVSPSHHFPTGTVMTISGRHKLLNWAAQKRDRYIIEDDYDSEFRLTGLPLPALQSLSESKVIYINTFTKSLAPTIRISYMILPKALAQKFYDELGFYSCTVSTFEQYTLAEFISQGYFEKHINRMRNYYKKIRNSILNEIKNSPLSSICEVSEEEAGLHFLLKLKTDKSDSFLKETAKQNALKISFLSEYYINNSQNAPQHILVMNYSAIKGEDIKDAVKALAKII